MLTRLDSVLFRTGNRLPRDELQLVHRAHCRQQFIEDALRAAVLAFADGWPGPAAFRELRGYARSLESRIERDVAHGPGRIIAYDLHTSEFLPDWLRRNRDISPVTLGGDAPQCACAKPDNPTGAHASLMAADGQKFQRCVTAGTLYHALGDTHEFWASASAVAAMPARAAEQTLSAVPHV